MKPPLWKCSDGRLLTVSDMTTEHIQNCVQRLRRAGYISIAEHRDGMPTPVSCSGDMASYYADIGWEHECDTWVKQKRTAWLDLFEKALEVRALLLREGQPA